jgi:hypothetical protein
MTKPKIGAHNAHTARLESYDRVYMCVDYASIHLEPTRMQESWWDKILKIFSHYGVKLFFQMVSLGRF